MQNSRLNSDSFSGPLNEGRAASTANGGTALTTTAQVIGFPGGTSHVSMYARNFVTAVVARVAINPYLIVFKSTDSLVTVTDSSSAAQKNPATTGVGLNALNTLANGHAVYLGSHVPFRGASVTMSASVNAIASVLSADYWNGAWTAVAGLSDGTAAVGATFAQTGLITYTVPTDWTAVQLSQTRVPTPTGTAAFIGNLLPYNNKSWYWLRLSVSAQLSATVLVNTLFSLNRSTAYAEMTENSYLQFRVVTKPGGMAGVEARTDAGTGSMIVNAYTDNPLGVLQ